MARAVHHVCAYPEHRGWVAGRAATLTWAPRAGVPEEALHTEPLHIVVAEPQSQQADDASACLNPCLALTTPGMEGADWVRSTDRDVVTGKIPALPLLQSLGEKLVAIVLVLARSAEGLKELTLLFPSNGFLTEHTAWLLQTLCETLALLLLCTAHPGTCCLDIISRHWNDKPWSNWLSSPSVLCWIWPKVIAVEIRDVEFVLGFFCFGFLFCYCHFFLPLKLIYFFLLGELLSF